jgi:hypothetical protein
LPVNGTLQHIIRILSAIIETAFHVLDDGNQKQHNGSWSRKNKKGFNWGSAYLPTLGWKKIWIEFFEDFCPRLINANIEVLCHVLQRHQPSFDW